MNSWVKMWPTRSPRWALSGARSAQFTVYRVFTYVGSILILSTLLLVGIESDRSPAPSSTKVTYCFFVPVIQAVS
jgi:hypothetical protein